MAPAQRRKEVVERRDVRVRRGGELVHPRVPRGAAADREALVGAPGGEDLRPERGVGRDGGVVLERVDGVVRGAERLDAGARDQPARGEPGLRDDGVGTLPDLVRGVAGEQQVVDAEVARQLQVAPVVHRVAQRVRHRLGELPELLARRGVAGDEALVDAVRAHDAPLVVVGAEPDLGDVLPAFVLRDLRGREVAVVVDDRERLGVAVVKLARAIVREEEVVVDEFLHGGGGVRWRGVYHSGAPAANRRAGAFFLPPRGGVNEIAAERVPLRAEAAVTKEPVPYAERLKLKYRPIKRGERWGGAFDCGWFHVTGEVPKAWRGACVTLNLDFHGEALVFDAKGCPLVGLTNGCAFLPGYRKDHFHWLAKAKGGEKVDFWVDAGANDMFGVSRRPLAASTRL